MCYYIGESNADGMCVRGREWESGVPTTASATNSRYYMCAMKTGEWDVEGSSHRKSWPDVKLGGTDQQGNKGYIYDFDVD